MTITTAEQKKKVSCSTGIGSCKKKSIVPQISYNKQMRDKMPLSQNLFVKWGTQ